MIGDTWNNLKQPIKNCLNCKFNQVNKLNKLNNTPCCDYFHWLETLNIILKNEELKTLTTEFKGYLVDKWEWDGRSK